MGRDDRREDEAKREMSILFAALIFFLSSRRLPNKVCPVQRINGVLWGYPSKPDGRTQQFIKQ